MSALTALAAKASLASWTLGSPRQGRTEYKKCVGYDPIPGRMAPSEPHDIWIAWAKHLEANRPPELLAHTLDQFVILSEDESAFGAQKVRNGLTSPMSGAIENPISYRSAAIARAAYWGLAWLGDPNKAAKYAYFDASLDHSGDGVWVPMAIAACIASSNSATSNIELASVFLNFLSPSSKVHLAAHEIRRIASQPESAREFRLKALQLLGEEDILHAAHSGSHFLLALLNGQSDPTRSILTAVSCGGATAQVASAIAMVTTLVQESFEDEWLNPLGTEFISSSALRQISTPQSIEEWANIVSTVYTPETELLESLPASKITSEPKISKLEVETDDSQVAKLDAIPTTNTDLVASQSKENSDTKSETAEETTPIPAELHGEDLPELTPNQDRQTIISVPSPEVVSITDQNPNRTFLEIGDFLVQVEFLSRVHSIPTLGLELQVTITNLTSNSINGQIDMQGAAGWSIAKKADFIRLDPNQPVSFLVVARPDTISAASQSHLAISINGVSAILPIPLSNPVCISGPFANPDGQGFEKIFPPENGFEFEQIMNGRSDMPVKWKIDYLPAIVLDIEDSFTSGPGVIFIYAELEFEKPGSYSIFVNSEIAAKVWIDQTKILSYHDQRPKGFDPNGRYSARFTSSGRSTLMVKTLRENKPVKPLILAFYDEDGKLTFPKYVLPEMKS